MPRKVVDTFNVDGEDYSIEPVLDPTPTEGSMQGVTSDGIFADKSRVPVRDSTKNFTAGGAFDFFFGSQNTKSWAAKLYGHLYGRFWTTHKIGINQQFARMAYSSDSGVFVVARGEFYPYWSEDLDNWTAGTGENLPSSSSGNLNTLEYANGKFVAVMTANGVYYSEDGKVWAKCSGFSGITSYQNGSYAGNKWFVGNSSSAGLWYSLDGVTFAQCTGSGATGSPSGYVFYKDGLYITNIGGTLCWSEDGIDWTAGTGTGATTGNYYVSYGYMRVMVNNAGELVSSGTWTILPVYVSATAISLDGKDWLSTGVTLPTGMVTPFVNIGLTWVVGTLSNGLYYSTDGCRTWTQATDISSNRVWSITYAHGVLICGSQTIGIRWSNDGISWNLVDGANVHGDGRIVRFIESLQKWCVLDSARSAVLVSGFEELVNYNYIG